jgi:hypothetical protein
MRSTETTCERRGRGRIPRRRRNRAAIVTFVAALAVTAAPAHAAVLTVAPGEVAVSDDGLCSLREAMLNANADAQVHDDCPAGSGADTIELAVATYLLAPGPARAPATALPPVTSTMTLLGLVNANFPVPAVLDAAAAWRHLEVAATGDLTVSGIRLKNGSAPGAKGGAILSFGSLTLDNVSVVQNYARQGGAIYNDGGTATVESTNFVDNHGSGAEDDQNSFGGAIVNSDGSVSIDDSSFQANTAPFGAGAIANTAGGSVSITATTLTQNWSLNGGAIYNNSNSTLSLTDGVVIGNGAGNLGGGIVNGTNAVLTITNSTLASNAGHFGGGIWSGGGSTLDVERSTLRGNSAHTGGGVYVKGSNAFVNSTLSGNAATHEGGGIYAAADAFVELANATLQDNAAPQGAALFLDGSSEIRNTIVAGSSGPSCSGPVQVVFPLDPGTHNLDEDDTCDSFVDGFSTVADVLTGPLQDNGGSTDTHLLHPGSAAVNAGHQATCNAIGATDQRGLPRTVGPSCDVGAVELQPQEPYRRLIEDVGALRVGDRDKEALTAQLEAAWAAAERGDTAAADSQLDSFTNDVEAQRGKAIAEGDADRLIVAASNARELLESDTEGRSR